MNVTPPYDREPIRFTDDIPVFVEPDEYSEVYAQIAADHLAGVAGDPDHAGFPPDDYVHVAERSTLELVQTYGTIGASILDVGVSRGKLLRNVPNLQRYGVDISLDYLAIARAEGIEASLARVEDLPYLDDAFDIVVCTDVLEHVIDLHAATTSVLRVLRPGGVLIVRVPYREDLSWYTSDDCPYKYAHLRTFDVPTLVLLFEHAHKMRIVDVMHASFMFDPRRVKRVGDEARLKELADLAATHHGELRWSLSESLLRPYVEGTEINVVVRKPLAAGEDQTGAEATPRDHRVADADTVEALAQIVTAQSDRLAVLTAEVSTRDASIGALENERVQAQGKIAELEQAGAAATSRADALERERVQAQGKIAELEQAGAAATSRADALERELEGLRMVDNMSLRRVVSIAFARLRPRGRPESGPEAPTQEPTDAP